MNYHQPKTQPEAAGARRLMKLMKSRGWLCMKLGGGKYTVGWPDWYCYHPKWGHKWIETKTIKGKLSRSQITRFIKMSLAGDKIYILTNERDYMKLFRNYDNWRMFK